MIDMKVCYLYPDVLNVNGSRGNLLCLAERAKSRGVEVDIIHAPMAYDGGFEGFDLIYIGAGHGEPDAALISDIRRIGPELQAFAGNGGVILAVCEGFELLCSTLTLSDGRKYEAAGLLDARVSYGENRATGNYAFDCGGEIGEVVAFRNTAARVTLGPDMPPLGHCRDGSAVGMRWKNVFASHGHGPLLPKNPRLADAVLAAAGVDITLINDELENAAHDYMSGRLS